jgi:hypothetical protein
VAIYDDIILKVAREPAPDNRDSVEAQPARASALRTGAHQSPVQLFITTRAPCRRVMRAAGQRATAAR